MENPTQQAKQVKRQFEKKWLAIEGVTAVGIGLLENGDAGIIISVHKNPDQVRTQIPTQVQGIRTEIKETGKFKAQ